MHTLTTREQATVLAALRFWQVILPHTDPEDLGEHFADVAPLNDDEINALCERLNTNGLEPLTVAYVGIGVVAGLHSLPNEMLEQVIDHHGGQLVVVQAALRDAAAQDIDSHAFGDIHAYDIAEPFGIAFVKAEAARLGGAA